MGCSRTYIAKSPMAEGTSHDTKYFTASGEMPLIACALWHLENQSAMLFLSTQHTPLLLSVSLEETSYWRGLVQVTALHESLKMKYEIFFLIPLWVFEGGNRNVMSRSIEDFPEETFAFDGWRQQWCCLPPETTPQCNRLHCEVICPYLQPKILPWNFNVASTSC